MSFQKEEKENNDIEQKQKDKNLSSNEINVDNYHFNVTDPSNFAHKNYKPPRPRNFDNFIHNQQTIKKTMKEIKYNFMQEHKNIINTYYSIYSKQLDEIIYHYLNNSKTMKEYSNTYSELNRNLMDNQTDTTRIINDIMDKNMDTFLKSIEFAHKFYFEVIQSYYNYIMGIKKSTEK